MNKLELQVKINLFRRELDSLEEIKVCCGTCGHFPQGRCELAQPPVRPPPQVTAVGCSGWEYDRVPF